jgi:hypothetical protein
MDCHKFHNNLEDYLEDGLDFSGRFGMERHAQQCLVCGEELAGAQRLRKMVHELNRVKAPANFESSLLSEIGKRKGRGRFRWFRKFWLYGFELQSLRKPALAGSGLAVLAIGFFYLSPHLSRRAAPEVPSAPAMVAQEPAKIERNENPEPAATPIVTRPDRPLRIQSTNDVAETTRASSTEPGQVVEQETTDTDYVELQMIGPDKRPVSFRLPDKSRYRGSQTAQEYFIRNVSH